MGVLVCSNELTKRAGTVGYRNKVVVLVVLVCDTKQIDNMIVSSGYGLRSGSLIDHVRMRTTHCLSILHVQRYLSISPAFTL